MKSKTIEQIALITTLGLVLYFYLSKKGLNITSPAASPQGFTSIGETPPQNGLPWFLTYNVPSGFTGQASPVLAVPGGTTGSMQPQGDNSIFTLSNQAQF